MKEICSVFDIILLEDIASADNVNVHPLPGRSFDKLTSASLDVDMDKDLTDAGVVFTLTRDVIIDKVPTTIATKYSYARTCIMIVYYTDGSHTVYGSPEYPVIAYIVSGMQQDTLSVSLKTTVFPSV